ncbi:MAG TPA: type II toxin-antitoxin system VapC family toxin [Pirellulaceae bacterium]
MIIDTNVLIRLERETRRGIPGEASVLFESLRETRICITPTIAGEIACGASMSGRETWERFLKPYEMVPIDAEATWHYGAQYRALSKRGELIGTNDLWIAATALAHQLPLATGNGHEFKRVKGLAVVSV